MFITKKVAVALIAANACLPCDAFSASVLGHSKAYLASPLHSTNAGLDTDPVLPSFSTKDEYTSYRTKAGSLPQGFAVGTAKGTFVSVEAPALGPLPIKATVIHLTEGPSESWAAVFTGNRVSGI